VTPGNGLSAPAGGFAFLAPAQDACEGDACVIPGAAVATATEGVPSLLGGDVRDRRVER
jgi:hypothetical protein